MANYDVKIADEAPKGAKPAEFDFMIYGRCLYCVPKGSKSKDKQKGGKK